MNKIVNMSVVKVVGVFWLLLHIFSMILYPAYNHAFQWSEIQDVWDRWQTLNAAMIALASSLIAFQINGYKEEKQRQRNFIAARAFLPEEFSELTSYCKQSAEVFKEVYGNIPPRPHGATLSRGKIITPLKTSLPTLPQGYKKVFQDCISQADDKVAQYLSYILMLLQVHNSRMVSLYYKCGPASTDLIIKEDIHAYLYRLSEIQALINNAFNYARGLADFDDSYPNWENQKNALGNFDIWPEDYQGLEGFIKRAIDQKGKDQ